MLRYIVVFWVHIGVSLCRETTKSWIGSGDEHYEALLGDASG